jgi:hypothetical protein
MPAPPPTTASPATPGPSTIVPGTPAEARNIDALVDLVPPDAMIVVALDLAQLHRSPSLAALATDVLAQTGLGDALTKTVRASGLDLSTGRALLIAGLPQVGDKPQPLVGFRGALDASAVTSYLTSLGAVAGTIGTDTQFTLPHTTVLMHGDVIAFGPPVVIASARAAQAGDSVAETSLLMAPIAVVRASPAGFVALRTDAALRKGLGAVAPDLASTVWIAFGIDTTAGVVFTGRAAFPSDAVAARVAAQLQAARAKLRMPNARFTSTGSIVEVVAPVDESELQKIRSVNRS